jgi:hypothetical protein
MNTSNVKFISNEFNKDKTGGTVIISIDDISYTFTYQQKKTDKKAFDIIFPKELLGETIQYNNRYDTVLNFTEEQGDDIRSILGIIFHQIIGDKLPYLFN